MPETDRRTFLLGGVSTLGALGLTALTGSPPARAASTPLGSTQDASTLPALDDLAGDWMLCPELLHPPAVTNFWGALQTTTNLGAFESLTLAPLSQGGSCFTVSSGGQPIPAQHSRWYPYQVVRTAQEGAIAFETRLRMVPEQRSLLLELTVRNTGSSTATVPLEVSVDPWIRDFPGTWQWDVPRPGNGASFTAALGADEWTVRVSDSGSDAVSVVAFAGQPIPALAITGGLAKASWSLRLPASGTATLGVVLATGTDGGAVDADARAAARDFTGRFRTVQTEWQRHWHDMFTPGNRRYSGHLPVFDTGDTDLRRLYYASVVSVLQVERTNFAAFPRVFVSSGPEWGTTLTYFWDTSFIAPLLAMLDPDVLREQVLLWLRSDIYNGYAVDMNSGRLVGPWYSANDLAVFTTALTYYDVTGDQTFLNAQLPNGSVLDRLEGIALHWQDLADSTGLADYGGLSNLLEEVSDYVNHVPALNSANVWMMREAARLRTDRGDSAAAARLTSLAENLAGHVLDLYVPGQGVWQSVHDDGQHVTVRHVYDFDTISRAMPGDLDERHRREMRAFVQDELLAADWMRALALSDPDAPSSLRPDHGSNGAYDSWPALAASGLARLGFYRDATASLRGFSGVAGEAGFAQSHQLTPALQGVLAWDRPDLNPSTALTVEAWINASSWPDQIWKGSIVSKDAYAYTGGAWHNFGYVLRGGDGGRLSFVVAVDDNFAEVQSSTQVPTGSWHHVCATYDGNKLVVYLNGTPVGTANAAGVITPASGYHLSIGFGALDSTRRFSGDVNDVTVYSRALSATEVASRAGAAPGDAVPPGAVCHLPIAEGTGTTTRDTVSGLDEPVLGGQWVTGTRGAALRLDPSTAPTRVRISPSAQLQDAIAANGGSFAATIVNDLFGYRPVAGQLRVQDSDVPRGFAGVLRHIPGAPGMSYEIEASSRGISARGAGS